MIVILAVLLLLLMPMPIKAQSFDQISTGDTLSYSPTTTYYYMCYGDSNIYSYTPPNSGGTYTSWSCSNDSTRALTGIKFTINNLDDLEVGDVITLTLPISMRYMHYQDITTNTQFLFTTYLQTISNLSQRYELEYMDYTYTQPDIKQELIQNYTRTTVLQYYQIYLKVTGINYSYNANDIIIGQNTSTTPPMIIFNERISPDEVTQFFTRPKIYVIKKNANYQANTTELLESIFNEIVNLDIDVDMTTTNNLLSTIANSLVTIGINQQTVSDNITDQLIANQVSTNTAINNQTNTIVNSITSLNGVVTNLPSNINLYIAAQTSSINARMDSNTDEIVTALGNIQINTTSLEDKITNLQTSLVNALQQQTQTLSGTNTQSEETDFLTQKDQFSASINSFQYSQNSQLGSNLNSNINHITNELTSFAALIGTDVPHPSTTNRPGDFRKCRNNAIDINTPMSFQVGSIRIPMTNNFINVNFFCPRQYIAKVFGVFLYDNNVQNLYNMSAVQSWSNPYNLTKLAWSIFAFGYISVDLIKLFYKIIQPQKVITELNGL